MRTVARLLLSPLALLASCGPGSEPPQGFKPAPEIARVTDEAVELVGTVRGAAGEPVAGAHVRIVPRWRALTTDAQGVFRVRLGPPADARVAVFVAAEGYATWGEDVELQEAQDEHALAIQLQPEARVSGTLRDEAGNAVAGAVLRVRYQAEDDRAWMRSQWHQALGPEAGFGLAEVVTGEDGSFAFAGLPAGNWTVRVPRGGEDAWWWESLAFHRTALQEGANALDLRLGDGLFDFHGQVVDARDGSPLGEVAIVPEQRSDSGGWMSTGVSGLQTSDEEDGRFVLRDLPGVPSDWRIDLHREGFVRETSEALGASLPDRPAVFGLAPPRAAEVRVVDGLGEPVYGAAILSLGINGATGVGKPIEMLSRASDRDGRIRLREVPAAPTRIWIWSHWRCTPEAMTVDFSLPAEGDAPLVEIALPGDHSSPRFAIPIRVDPAWVADPERRFTVEARDAAGVLIGEWVLRATPGQEHAYEVHLGGSSWSIFPRTGQLETPDFPGLLPVGEVQFSARQGDTVIAGPKRTIAATGGNEAVAFVAAGAESEGD